MERPPVYGCGASIVQKNGAAHSRLGKPTG
jgi:hypothetical protein